MQPFFNWPIDDFGKNRNALLSQYTPTVRALRNYFRKGHSAQVKASVKFQDKKIAEKAKDFLNQFLKHYNDEKNSAALSFTSRTKMLLLMELLARAASNTDEAHLKTLLENYPVKQTSCNEKEGATIEQPEEPNEAARHTMASQTQENEETFRNKQQCAHNPTDPVDLDKSPKVQSEEMNTTRKSPTPKPRKLPPKKIPNHQEESKSGSIAETRLVETNSGQKEDILNNSRTHICDKNRSDVTEQKSPSDGKLTTEATTDSFQFEIDDSRDIIVLSPSTWSLNLEMDRENMASVLATSTPRESDRGKVQTSPTFNRTFAEAVKSTAPVPGSSPKSNSANSSMQATMNSIGSNNCTQLFDKVLTKMIPKPSMVRINPRRKTMWFTSEQINYWGRRMMSDNDTLYISWDDFPFLFPDGTTATAHLYMNPTEAVLSTTTQKILISIWHEHHWLLVYINRGEKALYLLDPYKKSIRAKAVSELIKTRMDVFKAIFNIPNLEYRGLLQNKDHQPPENNDDCGPYVCGYMLAIVNEANYLKVDPQLIRKLTPQDCAQSTSNQEDRISAGAQQNPTKFPYCLVKDNTHNVLKIQCQLPECCFESLFNNDSRKFEPKIQQHLKVKKHCGTKYSSLIECKLCESQVPIGGVTKHCIQFHTERISFSRDICDLNLPVTKKDANSL